MRNLKDISVDELKAWLSEHRQGAFRVRQIRQWLYGKFAVSYDEMGNLPAVLRSQLSGCVAPFSLKPLKKLIDSGDGTVKWLSELCDGNTIETVLIRVPERSTVCISTQVGCDVRCVFCASGRHGLVRNLTKGEIIDQVILVCRELGRRVDNIVVMGMGEPMMNLENLVAALEEMSQEDALFLGDRHVTISTSGIVPGIRALASLERSWNLALSLHATTDEERAQIIPPRNRYPLEEIFDACLEYRRKTNRMLTLEYALIAGRNDDNARMGRLADIAHRLRAKVNLIPCNPAGSNCTAPALSRCRQCCDQLIAANVQATLRLSHGQKILAACGQLRQAMKK